ncbi:MAG TPA: hypothetical protein VL463_11840 [Kofleriaceae bacterium]|nr:hypothetical protein [Kofleriaceae bacterium]
MLLVACSSSARTNAPDAFQQPDAEIAQTIDATTFVDVDRDGLDDARELELAKDYQPFLSIDPKDGCPLDGMVVRVRKHPADPTKILIVYDELFQNDCGLGGHVGDDEVFGVAIDPSKPAPEGILAIKAASHQGTPCERDSECSTCGDSRSACDMANGWPVVYAAKDKHGHYATKDSCGTFNTCLDSCSLAPAAHVEPIANAGEPDHPLTNDLTANGFITDANGWTEADLMHFDPWDASVDFGGAGNIAGDLVDDAFTAAPCP